jgi:type I restriction enzyme S subunit
MNAETFCEHFATFADAPNAISKLRELIFQLAVQGKVVSQDKNDEPASVLFSKIQTEREVLIARRVIRRSKPLPQIDAAEWPFEIPATWLWVRFDDVGDWGAGATPNRGRPDYFGGEIKWFKSGELKKLPSLR